MLFSAVKRTSPTRLALTLAALIAGAPLPASTEEMPLARGAKSLADETTPTQKHPDEKFRQAQDMRYGAALYHYFQGNTFDALSTLMVSDLRGGIAHHADNADLIRGGISLAFGLERQAATLFEKQLHKTAGKTNQQRIARFREIAWLKLAELNYRHQNWDTAATQLHKSGAIHQSTLTLNLSIRSGDLAQAQQLLAMADLPLAEQVLGHSNLAAALARQQQLPAAAAEYRRAAALVEQQLDADEELRILRDKARIGAGYALALHGDFTGAAREFRGVRLDTPWSGDALLGLGWVSVNGGHHQQAVDALGYLINKNPLSPQVQEALLALPYSYEELARPKLALQSYLHAEQQYQQALGDLEALQQASTHLQFPLPAEDGPLDLQRYGWLEDAETPALIRNNQHYLLQMMQSDRLQLQLSELRDLHQLSRVLERWQQRLPEFHNLIDEREQRRIAFVQQHDSAQYDQQVQIAERELERLKTSLARIEADRDGLAMLSAAGSEESEYLDILRGAEARYQRLGKAGKTSKYQQQILARARGILQWQAADQYHENLWQKRKAIDTLEKQLTEAARRQRNVARIAAEAPQLNLLAGGVDEAGQRLAQQHTAVERASAAIQNQIRQDLQAALSAAQQRVAQYMAHTRLAIARIQDAAMQGMYAAPAAPTESPVDIPVESPAGESAQPVQPEPAQQQRAAAEEQP
ncbi:tetratricopeptide repeat protein [Microbulbifer hydrolyticus]|uniref:Tetratricopeptide repeat protein n=1 Tax=Microbulbifer hydrolyticus TaxID=48074 RepID=A0A6P1T4Q6_9GAMM|nr:hypothetical protein [Microbulbifer hydrolyticus]MBB5211531.1 hypothetical protein [Microbulbifer hydrolyticus]QHQ37728.1 hypothetical protein GTQ55_01150 [Microbulbifer hydrolyticus]